MEAGSVKPWQVSMFSSCYWQRLRKRKGKKIKGKEKIFTKSNWKLSEASYPLAASGGDKEGSALQRGDLGCSHFFPGRTGFMQPQRICQCPFQPEEVNLCAIHPHQTYPETGTPRKKVWVLPNALLQHFHVHVENSCTTYGHRQTLLGYLCSKLSHILKLLQLRTTPNFTIWRSSEQKNLNYFKIMWFFLSKDEN